MEVIETSSTICRMCGTSYGKMSGNFYKSYNKINKGVGYFPYCKECMDKIFHTYVKQCGDERLACRQMCRKFDLYWSDDIYRQSRVNAGTRNLFSAYVTKSNVFKHAGKSYDDTLESEGMLWVLGETYLSEKNRQKESAVGENSENTEPEIDEDSLYEISEETKTTWGPGYTNKMYYELEERRKYWIDNLIAKGVDTDNIGVQALLRQIVSTELDINKGRAAGDDVDKKINTFNTLIGSAMLKPTPKKETNNDSALENTPFGVWIKRWEDDRPIPEPDPELQDVDHLIKFISIWFLGHLCSMLNIKNSYCKLYEDKLAEMRIERPEFDDEDNESMFNDIFGSAGGDEDD